MSKLANFDKQFIETIQRRAEAEREHLKEDFGSWLLEAGNFGFPHMLMIVSEDFEYRESFFATLLYLAAPLVSLVAVPLGLAINMTESPIEKYMLLALTAIACRKADKVSFIVDEYRTAYGIESNTYDSEIIIEPQAKIGDYRVDFLITTIETFYVPEEDTIKKHLVVECDGHDFHEKTKEQAAKDKKRDRELQKKGFNVFRYSGSEIWQDAFECAENSIVFMKDKAKEEYYIKLNLSG